MAAPGTSAAMFERYEIDHKKRFGEGGYGATFAARDRKTNEAVVVKVIDTRKMALQKIQAECQFMETTRGHDNIILIHAHGLGEGKHSHLYFIFMERASGGELFDQLTTHNGPIPEKIAQEFFKQLVLGIAHCHACGVAHRDVKLENVLLNDAKPPVVKVIDFGLSHQYPLDAKGAADRSKLIEGFCGSKSYAAPEVLLGRGYDGFAADMWSLGVCLFGMLNGFFPVDEAKATDWRFGKLIKAQQQGKSSTSTILSWYKKTPAHLSASAIAVLDALLKIDAPKRLTMEQLLMHPFISGEDPTMAMYDDSGDALHYRGAGAQAYGGFYPSDDMEIMDDGPVYRSLGAAMEEPEDVALDVPLMPGLARQAAFGGVESLGDIFAL